MDRDRLTAAAVVAFFVVSAGLAASQRYTVSDPWQPYVKAVREYMSQALQGDSTALVRRSASAQPVAWVLDAAHRQPAMLNGWARQLTSGSGKRRGDTVVVLLWANDVAGCSHLSSVSASLLNHSEFPRVLAISSPCIDRHPLPALPW
jgi:hypothetical protein